MSKTITIPYVSRTGGSIELETVYAGGFLRWLYNTVSGRTASYLLFHHPLASRLYGWWTRLRVSRCQVRGLMNLGDVNDQDFESPRDGFRSFNEFFTRDIDLRRRPMPASPTVCVAPVDGKVLAYNRVRQQDTMQIKQHRFTLEGFLNDPALVRRFDQGSMLICRLSLADYHHFHFPDRGRPGRSHTIPGSLRAGGPYARQSLLPFYSQNRRTLTPFLSDHFGLMLIVEIGALTVGSIVQSFQPHTPVARGQKKGFFQLGGSTVVLLFQRGMIQFDDDLQQNTAKGLETEVQMGDSVGRATFQFAYSDVNGGMVS